MWAFFPRKSTFLCRITTRKRSPAVTTMVVNMLIPQNNSPDEKKNLRSFSLSARWLSAFTGKGGEAFPMGKYNEIPIKCAVNRNAIKKKQPDQNQPASQQSTELLKVNHNKQNVCGGSGTGWFSQGELAYHHSLPSELELWTFTGEWQTIIFIQQGAQTRRRWRLSHKQKGETNIPFPTRRKSLKFTQNTDSLKRRSKSPALFSTLWFPLLLVHICAISRKPGSTAIAGKKARRMSVLSMAVEKKSTHYYWGLRPLNGGLRNE